MGGEDEEDVIRYDKSASWNGGILCVCTATGADYGYGYFILSF